MAVADGIWTAGDALRASKLNNPGNSKAGQATTGRIAHVGVLFSGNGDLGSAAGAPGSSTVYTRSLLANTLFQNGMALRYSVGGAFAGNANANKRVRLQFGVSILVDSGALSTNGGLWNITGIATRIATDTIRFHGVFYASTGSLFVPLGTSLASQDFTINNGLYVVLGGTSLSDTIVRDFKIELLPADPAVV